MRIEPRQTDNIVVKSRTVQKITFRVFMTAALVATALNIADFSAMGYLLKVILKRGGRTYQLYADALQPIAMDSVFGTGLFSFLSPANAAGTGIVLVPNGVTTKEVQLIPMEVDLGAPLNLSGSDELMIEVSSNGSEFSSDIDTTASFMEVDFEEAAGVEVAVPIIECEAVTANASSKDYEIGDGTVKATLMNLDKTSSATSNQVVTGVNVFADNYGTTDTWSESFTKSVAGMSKDDIAFVGQSLELFKLPHGHMIHNVRLNLSYTTTNVNGGKNFIVKRRFESSPLIASRAAAKIADIKNTNNARLGTGVAPVPVPRITSVRTSRGVSN